MYAEGSPASILYAMGITQHTHGTDNVLATSNLALLTGNVGLASGGVNPLRGQSNVQGACDMGALPNVYPGYQRVDVPEVQAKFDEAWGAELDPAPGLTHLEILRGVTAGPIKAIYLVGENPVLSEADANHARKAMEQVDFLVVQDIFLTESAQYADVVLPAASFAEKDGTFTNTERRVQRVRKAIEPVGESRDDWWITCAIARRLGAKGFDFESAAEVMAEIASLTPSYGGITYDRIDDVGLQWPCPDASHPGTRYLHAERFPTPSGRGRFVPAAVPPARRGTRRRVPARAHHGAEPVPLPHVDDDAARRGARDPAQRGAGGDPPARRGGADHRQRGPGPGDLPARRGDGAGPGDGGVAAGHRQHDVPLPRGADERAHQRRLGSRREDPRDQGLRGARRARELTVQARSEAPSPSCRRITAGQSAGRIGVPSRTDWRSSPQCGTSSAEAGLHMTPCAPCTSAS